MSSPSSKLLVLRSYRHLLKSIVYVFKNDTSRIIKMFSIARSYYIEYKNIPENQIQSMILHAEDAALYLRNNIVQGIYDKNSNKVQVQAKEVNNEQVEISPITQAMKDEFSDIKHPFL